MDFAHPQSGTAPVQCGSPPPRRRTRAEDAKSLDGFGCMERELEQLVKTQHRNSKNPQKPHKRTGDAGHPRVGRPPPERKRVCDESACNAPPDEAYANPDRVDGSSPNESEEGEDHALQAVDAALDLIKQREKRLAEQEQQSKKLPLFHPGKTYTAVDAAGGFRVQDGYSVCYNGDGDVSVSKQRDPDHKKGNTHIIRPRAPEDKKLAWMYWSDTFRNQTGMSLRDCAIHHGMGGWQNDKRGFRTKVIYLDEGRSSAPGRCFILAVASVHLGQLKVKGHEESHDVYVVYRSAVPDEVQKLITLRDLINIRQANSSGDSPIPSWWEM